MNTYSRSVVGLQKLFAAMALFTMVFSPLAGVQFTSADTGGPGTITSAVYDEASNTLTVSGTYKDAPLGDKKTPGFAVFKNGKSPENKGKSLDNPITLLPHQESGVWSNTYTVKKAPTSVCVVIYDIDPTLDSGADGKHSLVPDGDKRNKDNSYDEKKWGNGSWLEGSCVTPEVIPDTVKICHATAAHGNPYNLQTPAKTADAGGHDGHAGPVWFSGIEVEWGDIIPPFEYDGGTYKGLNWGIDGQAIHENDCEVPEREVLGCTDPEAINYNPNATDGNDEAKDCEYRESTATFVAHKIVCELESEIPNQSDWGTLESIDNNTAQAWVDSHDSCEFAEGWDFEWILDGDKVDPGDTLVGPAGGDWTTFGSTDVNGMTSVSLTSDDLDGEDKVWFREVLKANYLTFSHDPDNDGEGSNDNDNSAAFFCNDDVLNYDNLEWIKDIELGNTYNCVAWNYVEPVYGCTDEEALNYNPKATHDDRSCEYPELVCDYGFEGDKGKNLLVNGSFEEDKVDGPWERFASVVGWTVESIVDGLSAGLELHRGWSGNEAADGEQYAELDAHESGARDSVRVSQEVDTIPGATYELRWAFAPRHKIDADQNQLSVLVDDVEVATEGPESGLAPLTVDDWTFGDITFDAEGDSTEIAFEDAGLPQNDQLGTFLDDAVLCLVEEPKKEDPWCSFEGVVIDHTADEDAKTNGGALVNSDRRDPTAVETIAPYANFGGKEGNDWQVDPLDFFSLGIGGFVTYEFTGDVAFDQSGADIAIYEITGGNAGEQTDEKVEVEVSENGVDWYSLGEFVGDAEIDISPSGYNYVKYVRLTDKSQGIQGKNGDGYDLDGIVILEGSCGDEPDSEPKQCIVYSDETTLADGTDSVLAWVHGNWTTELASGDAEWIWDAADSQSVMFTKTFNVDGAVSPATLEVAADNTYSVKLNGNPLACDGTGTGNFAAVDTCDAPVTVGVNTLEFTVTNAGGPNDPPNNPAGLIYELTIEGSSCSPVIEEPELETITMCKYDENEEAVSGWGMTLTNGDDITLDLETGNDGCVSYDVDPEDGPWEVYEEDRSGWTFVEAYAVNGIVIDDEVADYCEFFGFQSEETQSLAFVAQDIEVQIDPEYICDFMNDEDEDTPRRSTSGGSSSPRCDAFGIDGDVLSWETRRGHDLEITQNGETIFSTDDDDEVDEGEYTLGEFALVGDEFELTVNRGSRDDTCSFEIPGDGEVLGESTELPVGAPDTGHGGTSSAIPVLPSLLAILNGMRRVKNA